LEAWVGLGKSNEGTVAALAEFLNKMAPANKIFITEIKNTTKFFICFTPLRLVTTKNAIHRPKSISNANQYKKLLNFGGFPEPFFEGSERFYGMWRKTHGDLSVPF
jgi:hypothetical protein